MSWCSGVERRDVEQKANVWVLQGMRDCLQTRHLFGSTKNNNARERLERSVITFWVNDAQSVALQNKLLAEESRDPGLP